MNDTNGNTATGTLVEPTEVALLAPAQSLLDKARSMVIDCPEMLQVAADELGAIKRKSKDLEAERMTMTRPLDESKARIIAKYRKPLEYLAQAEAALKDSVRAYNERVDQERREAQRKADNEARIAREAAEREAIAAQAKADRDAQALRDQAAAAAAEGDTVKATVLETKAEQVQGRGDDKAADLANAAAMAPTRVTLPDAPKAKGVNMVKRYNAEVVDEMALILFVAANPMFRHLLNVNQTAIDAQARALKEQFAIPGCRLVVTNTVSARAA